MRLIRPSFDVIHQSEGLEGVFKQIELAGRTCYKSEDKITDTSSKEFVDKMINLGHTAMLEHGTVYLSINSDMYETKFNREAHSWNTFVSKYRDNKYSEVIVNKYSIYITTNYRVLIENDWLDDLQYLCEPTKFHEKRISVRFICDRGVSHEFVRHRVFSFAQESTRYCNYSKDKFDNELTFILPCWSKIEPVRIEDSIELRKFIWGTLDTIDETMTPKIPSFDQSWLHILLDSETTYCGLISRGYTPQQARAVLPNSLKTELVMTGFESDWNHFFELRCSSKAHPQAQELAIPLKLFFEITK